jgi:hypothetical protein
MLRYDAAAAADAAADAATDAAPASLQSALLRSPLLHFYVSSYDGPMPPLKTLFGIVVAASPPAPSTSWEPCPSLTSNTLCPADAALYRSLVSKIIATLAANKKQALLPPWEQLLSAVAPETAADPVSEAFFRLASAPPPEPGDVPPLSESLPGDGGAALRDLQVRR